MTENANKNALAFVAIAIMASLLYFAYEIFISNGVCATVIEAGFKACGFSERLTVALSLNPIIVVSVFVSVFIGTCVGILAYILFERLNEIKESKD